MQKIGYQGLIVGMYCLFGQTKSLFKEVELWSLHSPQMSQEEDRKEQILL
jgi:hypothetical protein